MLSNVALMMVAMLGTKATGFFQDACTCLDVALVYDDVEHFMNGIPDIVSTAQSVSGGVLRMGAMSFKDTINVDCDLTEDIDLFERAFEDAGVATRHLSGVEANSEPSSEALSFAVSGTTNQMCGPPPPFGNFRQECKKLVFLITSATKLAGACRSPTGPADSFCSPLEVATAAVGSEVVISVIETNEEANLPASSELQVYPTVTGGAYGKVTDKLPTLHLLKKFLNLLCKPSSTFAPVSAPTHDPFISGDPHVHTADGRIVDVFLQPGVWTPLVRGLSFSITGRVFSLNERDATTKWFDGFRVEDALSGKVIFEAVLPHDIAVGSVSESEEEVQYLNVSLGDKHCNKINVTCEYGVVAATPTKLESAARIQDQSSILNDRIDVATPDFEFDIVVAAALDPDSFDSYEEMIEATHIEFKFTRIPNHHDLQGPLAELMYPNLHRERGLSTKTFAMSNRPNAAV